MPRSEKINDILQIRQQKKEKVQNKLNKVMKFQDLLRKVIGQLEVFEAMKYSDSFIERCREIRERLNDYLTHFQNCARDFDQLKARFGRHTLNVGVVGAARIGKSTFLQSLTNLDGSIIPSGDGGHCTGAPSLMVHKEVDYPYADIEFYSESEFLSEVIAPYCEQLKLSPPRSLSEFQTMSLRDVSSAAGDTTAEEFLRRLQARQANLEAYRHLLGAQMARIPEEEIRKYVAQEDVNQNRQWYWLAVKKALVNCRFPIDDITRIAIGDTPGLGDFVGREEERLAQNVGNNMDIVVFMDRPDPLGTIIQPRNTRWYDKISGAFPELPLESWAYCLINQYEQGDKGLEKANKLESEIRKSAMRFNAIYTVNCLDKNKVRSTFDSIVTDAACKIDQLDNTLSDKRFKSLDALAAQLLEYSQSVGLKTLLGQSAHAESMSQDWVEEDFENAWYELADALTELVNRYKETKNEINPKFQSNLERIHAELEAFPGELSEERRTKFKRQIAAWQSGNWYEIMRQSFRLHVSEKLNEMDKGFDELFAQLREETRICFANAGKLSGLIGDSSDWLKDLADQMDDIAFTDSQKHGGDYCSPATRMAEIIRVFRSMTLSFRGFLQPRIRGSLNCLDVDSGDQESRDYAYAPAPAGKQQMDYMWEILSAAVKNANSKAYNQINEYSREPSMALFSTIEEFVDAILRTGGADAAKTIWRRFYQDNVALIWPERTHGIQENSRMRRDWLSSVEDLENLCR